MKKIYSTFFGIVLSASLFAQLQLKPAIGPTSLPNDNDAICSITCSPSSWNFNTDGLLVGDTIPQFQFYSLNGTPTDALTLLQTGKPLCIVAGSFTCPVWRGKIAALNTLISTYGSQVNFLVVYVVEAHPMSPDVSPYSCNVWNPSQNQTDGVMYLQPTTYGQRKATATDMMNNICTCIPAINAPMVIDGPCNDFWLNLGPAPNNAYLINPIDGTVYCKHGWFNQAPNDMGVCISNLLAVLSVNEESSSENISLYPNPSADGKIQVSSLKSQVSSLMIYNTLGEKIYSADNFQIGSSSNFQIDLSAQPKGIYFFKLTDDANTNSSGKLIIE